MKSAEFKHQLLGKETNLSNAYKEECVAVLQTYSAVIQFIRLLD